MCQQDISLAIHSLETCLCPVIKNNSINQGIFHGHLRLAISHTMLSTNDSFLFNFLFSLVSLPGGTNLKGSDEESTVAGWKIDWRVPRHYMQTFSPSGTLLAAVNQSISKFMIVNRDLKVLSVAELRVKQYFKE